MLLGNEECMFLFFLFLLCFIVTVYYMKNISNQGITSQTMSLFHHLDEAVTVPGLNILLLLFFFTFKVSHQAALAKRNMI